MGIGRLRTAFGVLLVTTLLAGCGDSPAAATPASPHVTPSVAPRGGGPIYAALGASETFGLGADPFTRGYAFQLRDALGASGFTDLGIPGATLQRAHQGEVAGALAVHPTLCTLFFGVNDVRRRVDRDAFVAELSDVARSLHSAGCRTFVIGLPDLRALPAVVKLNIPGIAGIARDWNSHIATAAVAAGATYVSLAAFTAELAAHPEYLAPDGLHPSTAGHTRLAAILLAAIRASGSHP